MKRTSKQIRKGHIQWLSGVYNLRPEWVVWYIIPGYDRETLEANLREWLTSNGCELFGKTIHISNQQAYSAGVAMAKRGWINARDEIERINDLALLNAELEGLGHE